LFDPLGIHPGSKNENQDKNARKKDGSGITMIWFHNSKISSTKGRDNLSLSKTNNPEIKTRSLRFLSKTNKNQDKYEENNRIAPLHFPAYRVDLRPGKNPETILF
jgi:hypothetical protein